MNFRNHLLFCSAATALAAAARAAHAQCATPNQLTPGDPQADSYFAGALALDGPSMLVGSNSRTVSGMADAGKVYAFAPVGGVWSQVGQIIPNDPSPSAWFGMSIGMGGGNQWAVVGAAGYNAGNGKAYLFRRNANNTWSQVDAFAPGLGPSARFGQSAAMNKTGTIAVVAAPYAEVTDLFGTTDDAGLALVYHRNANNTWTYEMELHQYDASLRHTNDFYGMGLAADGDTIVAGAPNGDAPGKVHCGYIHIWNRDAFGGWTANGEVYAPDATAGDMFGESIAIGAGTLAVASVEAVVNGQSGAGAVYLYRMVNGVWVFDAKIPSPPNQTWFGSSLAVSGDHLVVGSESGMARAWVFRRVGPGQWIQDAVYQPPAGSTAFFGANVAAEGNQFVVGDWDYQNGNMISAGAAYRYDFPTIGSDSCQGAPARNQGSYWGCTSAATVDGASSCGTAQPPGPDVWFSHTPTATGTLTIDTQGSPLDTILSIHSGCPGNLANAIVCNDDVTPGTLWSKVTLPVTAGVPILIRVAGYNGAAGAFQLTIGPVVGCYANCDASTGSPLLTANDFTCFINAYAVSAPYANCDGSTGNPALTANDFTCFINAFAAGCS